MLPPVVANSTKTSLTSGTYLGSGTKLEARVDRRIGCLAQPKILNVVGWKAYPDPDSLRGSIDKISKHGPEHGGGDRDVGDVVARSNDGVPPAAGRDRK
jgi:hypothetical protein